MLLTNQLTPPPASMLPLDTPVIYSITRCYVDLLQQTLPHSRCPISVVNTGTSIVPAAILAAFQCPCRCGSRTVHLTPITERQQPTPPQLIRGSMSTVARRRASLPGARSVRRITTQFQLTLCIRRELHGGTCTALCRANSATARGVLAVNGIFKAQVETSSVQCARFAVSTHVHARGLKELLDIWSHRPSCNLF